MHRRHLLSLAALPALGPRRSTAAEATQGAVLLTIGGRCGRPELDYGMARLERMPQASFNARLPWYPQPRKFTGPLLRDLLAAGDCQGSQLRALALNDYRVDIPFDDALRYDVIVARLIDDQPMGIRDKGPLMIIYPFDSHAELRNAVYYGRCAWQLRRIEVL